LLRQVSKPSLDEVDNLVRDLQALRRKLQTDGDRIQRDIAEHGALSQQVLQLTHLRKREKAADYFEPTSHFKGQLDHRRAAITHGGAFRRAFSGAIMPRELFTLNAIQFFPDPTLTTILGGDPWSLHPGRIVAHVLSVPTFQFGDPVIVRVRVKSDDFPFHRPVAGS